jgi:hypothetical protein
MARSESNRRMEYFPEDVGGEVERDIAEYDIAITKIDV